MFFAFWTHKLTLVVALQLSVHDIISASYEAGGVYPTLLGYAVGAVGTFGVVVSKNLALRLLSVLLSVLIYIQCLQDAEQRSSAVLLSIAALTGIGCTYVQVLSWKRVFGHAGTKRKSKKKTRNKILKED